MTWLLMLFRIFMENMNCLSDCWMSAQEALNYRLIDGIMDEESEMSNYE